MKHSRAFTLKEILIVLALLVLTAALIPNVMQMQRYKAAEANYAVVKVFYATDRNLTSAASPTEKFGSTRSELRYGTCDVSIPRDHRMGELEKPSILKLEFRPDPEKHVVLLNVAVQSREGFFSELGKRVQTSGKKSAFLFVHGYNVTFEDAARRTAQISYDLGFDGAPIFYSWPSEGSTPKYTVDESNAEWTETNLKGFLQDFLTRSDAENIFLISHSMGGRPLTRALISLFRENPAQRKRFRELILAAPDIDAEVFKRDIVPALHEASQSTTLYASSKDFAMVASKKVHGYPRAGESGAGLVVIKGIETIDATEVDTGLAGHSYYAESRSVLSDFFYLLNQGQRADQRFGLLGIDSPLGRYWAFKK